LRGLSTLGANVSLLVSIDGIITGSLANLDPSDIESINISKCYFMVVLMKTTS